MDSNDTTFSKAFDVAGPGSAGVMSTARPIMPQPIAVSDSTVTQVGFDAPAKDPDAIPITVNRPQPTMPSFAPSSVGSPATAAAIAEDNESALPPAQPINAGQLFQPDSEKPHPMPEHLGPHEPDMPDMPHDEGPHRRRSKWWMWLLLLLVILAGAYLAIDDRLIKTNINLPYHFFSQPAVSTTAATTTNTSSTTQASVPSGFSQYQLNAATIQFAAPTTWGTPSFTSDPGFSQRGGGAKSDGTHAYLVSFAQNKDVQLALTAPGFLPASSTDSRYFDYLQWCQGTIDHNFYLQKLVYTTSKGVDSPATVACDQGPLVNVTQINSTTLMESQVKSTDGSVIGDIYVENLSSNSTVSVIRALDATSKNADDIKTLLTTVSNQ